MLVGICHRQSFSARIWLSLALATCAVSLNSRADAAGPTVTVVSIDGPASEAGPKSATFMFTREAAAIDKALTVPFTFSGTATSGADYGNPGSSVTFLPQSPFATLKITPVKDTLVEGDETVVLTLTAGAGYVLGDEKSATITIVDASGGKSTGKSPAEDRRSTLPPADRTGSLVVSISFDGKGTWKHPTNGAYSNMKFHREISYTVPLTGMYSAGSGFTEIDRREPMIPDFQHFLIGQPRDAVASAGTPCGRGTVSVLDESSGMEVGDPGQPPLVPFTQQIKGGGPYPSGDKTVPERDLCLTRVSFDNAKHVLHLLIDGTDTHVKVTNIHNGHQASAYNLRLQGEGAETKEKFTLLDLPIPAGAMTAEGSKTLIDVSSVSGPANTHYPLSAIVKWRVLMK